MVAIDLTSPDQSEFRKAAEQDRAEPLAPVLGRRTIEMAEAAGDHEIGETVSQCPGRGDPGFDRPFVLDAGVRSDPPDILNQQAIGRLARRAERWVGEIRPARREHQVEQRWVGLGERDIAKSRGNELRHAVGDCGRLLPILESDKPFEANCRKRGQEPCGVPEMMCGGGMADTCPLGDAPERELFEAVLLELRFR